MLDYKDNDIEEGFMPNDDGNIMSMKVLASGYTRSPSQDSRLFGPRPWKVLALIV